MVCVCHASSQNNKSNGSWYVRHVSPIPAPFRLPLFRSPLGEAVLPAVAAAPLPTPPPLGNPNAIAALIAFFTSTLRDGDKPPAPPPWPTAAPNKPPQVLPCGLSLAAVSPGEPAESLMVHVTRRMDRCCWCCGFYSRMISMAKACWRIQPNEGRCCWRCCLLFRRQRIAIIGSVVTRHAPTSLGWN